MVRSESMLSVYSQPSLADRRVVYSAWQLFQKLTACLPKAIAFHSACQRLANQSKTWGVPKNYFFDAPSSEPEPKFPEPFANRVRARAPELAAAWDELTERANDATIVCQASLESRCVARSMQNLIDGLQILGADHAAGARLYRVLNVADSWTVTVLDPWRQVGCRVELDGVENLGQLHILLTKLLPGESAARGVCEAYESGQVVSGVEVATAHYQLYRPSTFSMRGQLPGRFDSIDAWYWGHEPVKSLETERGEAVLVVGPPPYRRQWVIDPTRPNVQAGVRLLHWLDSAECLSWWPVLGLSDRHSQPLTDLTQRNVA